MRSSKRHVWVRNAETGNYELDVDPSLFITANQLETLSMQGMAENEDIMAMAKRNKARALPEDHQRRQQQQEAV